MQPHSHPEFGFVLVVPGKPLAQARPRAFARGGQVRMFSPVAGTSKADIAKEFLGIAYGANDCDWKPWEGPVCILMEYHFLAPKSAWPGKECTSRPDLDNLDKLVLDALNGVAFRDDSQVIEKTSVKLYGAQEKTVVRLGFYLPTPKPVKARRKAVA